MASLSPPDAAAFAFITRHTGSSGGISQIQRAMKILRANIATWVITGILPLPILVATDPASSCDIACVYLGLGCGWLAMEIYASEGLPASVRDWRQKISAISIAVAINAAIFVAFGMAAGVESNFPFLLKAALSVIPAIGVVPWLMRRVRQRYMVIVFGSMIVLAAKLLACVVARIQYGPDYIAKGYVSADWNTAKMMISLFWIFSTMISLILLLTEYVNCRRRGAPVIIRKGQETMSV